jgi:hypothetical protein
MHAESFDGFWVEYKKAVSLGPPFLLLVPGFVRETRCEYPKMVGGLWENTDFAHPKI